MVGLVKSAKSTELVAVATAAATSLATSTTFTLMPIAAHSLTTAGPRVIEVTGSDRHAQHQRCAPAVVQPPDESRKPLWDKTSRAHCSIPSPLCAVPCATVVVVAGRRRGAGRTGCSTVPGVERRDATDGENVTAPQSWSISD